jgi:hypothetical protein
MNMMRKNNNRNNNMKHRSGGSGGGGNGGGGARRYNNNSSGGGNHRSGGNDSQNLQRQKHHATQQLGKFGDMARNAQINGDRVDVEYYLQHVDHYTRVLTDIAAIEAERYAHTRESQIVPGGPNDPSANHGDAHGSAAAEPSSHDAAAGTSEGDAPSADATTDAASPRAPRQPRRAYQQKPDNGAREANSNTDDIPLPGSILPPI